MFRSGWKFVNTNFLKTCCYRKHIWKQLYIPSDILISNLASPSPSVTGSSSSFVFGCSQNCAFHNCSRGRCHLLLMRLASSWEALDFLLCLGSALSSRVLSSSTRCRRCLDIWIGADHSILLVRPESAGELLSRGGTLSTQAYAPWYVVSPSTRRDRRDPRSALPSADDDGATGGRFVHLS